MLPDSTSTEPLIPRHGLPAGWQTNASGRVAHYFAVDALHSLCKRACRNSGPVLTLPPSEPSSATSCPFCQNRRE